VPVEGADADLRSPGDVVHLGLYALLGEQVVRGAQDHDASGTAVPL
jgi:hypothetical protein